MGKITSMAEEVVAALDGADYYPDLPRIDAFGEGAIVMVGGRWLVSFASNDYLGFNRDLRVVEASVRATKQFGMGTGGSRLTAGTQSWHTQLEDAIAAFKNTEAAVVFSTGYLANFGILSALTGVTLAGVMEMLGVEGPKPLDVFSDVLNHASIIDGLRMMVALGRKLPVRVFKYQHRDMDDLTVRLSASRASRKLVITDGVFSLHGRIAPLDRIVELARRYGAEVYVDDAHGLGVLGETGRGTAEYFGVDDKVDFPLGTLSKALGGQGGYMVGSDRLCRYLRVAARTYMFQTSMPPGVAAGLIEAFRIMKAEPERRTGLVAKAARVRQELTRHGFNIFGTKTQIIPVGFGDAARAKQAAHTLLGEGIFAPPYYYPAVGPDEAMVRVNITALHTEEQLDQLLDKLVRIGRDLGILGAVQTGAEEAVAALT